MTNDPQKPPEKKIDTAAIKIIGVAAGVYLTITFWYIAVPVLILIGLLLYWQFKKNQKFHDSMQAKFGGMWTKFKKFMTR
jgi:hypothetical protein